MSRYPGPPATKPRRDAVDVARVLALAFVVSGHLILAVIDRPHGTVRGANLLVFHPGLAFLTAAAPMPVFFAAGGYANATAAVGDAARRLRLLAALGSIVVVSWSIGVVVMELATGSPGIVGSGARLATQPLWFVAAYAPFSAAGRPLAHLAARHPLLSIGTCLAGLAVLDAARFAFDAPQWIAWGGFVLAWVVPWLAGAWWRDRSERQLLDERRVGVILAVGSITVALVLVHAFGYSAALIDAVPRARSNTTPPTLYTAVAGLAQVGVLLVAARLLDRIGRRWRAFWTRAGEAAVGVYVWHLTALSLCAAVIAAGFPAPVRFTASWWITRPLWWAAVIGVALVFVMATDRARRSLRRFSASRDPLELTTWRAAIGVAVLAAAGAAVGIKGPRTLPLATAWSLLFVTAWWLLRGSRHGRDRSGQCQKPTSASVPSQNEQSSPDKSVRPFRSAAGDSRDETTEA